MKSEVSLSPVNSKDKGLSRKSRIGVWEEDEWLAFQKRESSKGPLRVEKFIAITIKKP